MLSNDLGTFMASHWVMHIRAPQKIDQGNMLGVQVPAVPRRLLCGGRDHGQRILLEAHSGAHGAAPGPLERHVAVLEHRRCAPMHLCWRKGKSEMTGASWAWPEVRSAVL